MTVNAGQSKTYGANDPVFAYTSSPAVGSALANGLTISFTGALARAAGENVGSSYAINEGSLANTNYNISFTGSNFSITQLNVSVTANSGQAKVYGSLDPASFTYTSSPAVGSALANGQTITFTGVLSRAAGENVGSYAIYKNTLANPNYNISYTGANFSITQLNVSVTANHAVKRKYMAH